MYFIRAISSRGESRLWRIECSGTFGLVPLLFIVSDPGVDGRFRTREVSIPESEDVVFVRCLPGLAFVFSQKSHSDDAMLRVYRVLLALVDHVFGEISIVSEGDESPVDLEGCLRPLPRVRFGRLDHSPG